MMIIDHGMTGALTRLELARSKMKVNDMDIQHLKYARKRVIFLYNKWSICSSELRTEVHSQVGLCSVTVTKHFLSCQYALHG